MKFEDLEIGHCYSRGDDASYKVIDKGSDWVLVLSHSSNHRVATPWIFSSKEINEDNLYEETDEWDNDVFNNLEYHDYDMLKEKED